jgi:hypothetical protein
LLLPHEATLRSRLGAYALHASHDPRETTAKARATFLSRFEREVDPDGILPEAERLRRANYLRKAHFTRLALKSARGRSRNNKNAPVVDETTGALTEVRDVTARPSNQV